MAAVDERPLGTIHARDLNSHFPTDLYVDLPDFLVKITRYIPQN
jgi:hypothetical protein